MDAKEASKYINRVILPIGMVQVLNDEWIEFRIDSVLEKFNHNVQKIYRCNIFVLLL